MEATIKFEGTFEELLSLAKSFEAHAVKVSHNDRIILEGIKEGFIPAIRLARQLKGLSLRDAKDLVEAIVPQCRVNYTSY